jgi:peptidylprolyl isomerase
VSQPNRRKGTPPAQNQNNGVPGAISAAVVIVIFIALGFMLSNRAGGEATPAAPTAAPFSEATAVTAPTIAPAAEGPAADVAARVNKYTQAPTMAIDTAKSYIATITTPRGNIVIKLRPDLAPQTVNSFVFLAREGYFNNVTWHRVIPGFVAQGGDPTGTGMGGPGYTIPGEFTNQVLFDKPGLVAMARPGNDINGNGSQFFITLAPTPSLNEQYTIFGEVIEGLDIVEGIPARDPDTASTPGEQMLSVTITED